MLSLPEEAWTRRSTPTAGAETTTERVADADHQAPVREHSLVDLMRSSPGRPPRVGFGGSQVL
jgi:hypothetical protein